MLWSKFKQKVDDELKSRSETDDLELNYIEDSNRMHENNILVSFKKPDSLNVNLYIKKD